MNLLKTLCFLIEANRLKCGMSVAYCNTGADYNIGEDGTHVFLQQKDQNSRALLNFEPLHNPIQRRAVDTQNF